MSYTAYPLSWPLQQPRTAATERKAARFSGTTKSKNTQLRPLTVAEGRKRVMEQLDLYTKPGQNWRIDLELVVVSTNVPTRQDGQPRSGLSEPTDPGAAVYFTLDGKPYCLPCDYYNRVADNLAAIAAHLEAGRTIERHHVGTAHNVFSDFKALPEQSVAAPWYEVLGVSEDASPDEVNAAFRNAAKQAHPDKGGSDQQMAILNEARFTAMQRSKKGGGAE